MLLINLAILDLNILFNTVQECTVRILQNIPFPVLVELHLSYCYDQLLSTLTQSGRQEWENFLDKKIALTEAHSQALCTSRLETVWIHVCGPISPLKVFISLFPPPFFKWRYCKSTWALWMKYDYLLVWFVFVALYCLSVGILCVKKW